MKGLIERLCFVGLMAGTIALASGCSGEMYLGARRIDNYEARQSMTYKPWKCIFTVCDNEGGAENHGS